MNRIFSLLITAALLFSLLSACGTPSDGPQDSPVQPEQSDSPIQPQPDQQPELSEEPQPSQDPAPSEEPESLVLEDVYQSILSAQEGNGLDPLFLFPENNPDALNSYYPGLGDVALAQFVYYTPPVFGHACEILLVEVTDKKDVDTVKDILQERIDRAASDTSYPENAKPWSRNAQIQIEGNYLCMIVLPDGYTVPDNVFSLD